jgi:hypothetical protein
MHDWQTVAGALSGGIPDGIEMEFASDGPGMASLVRLLAPVAAREPARLTLAGTREDAGWRRAMIAADVALVTMRPGAENVVMPSKAYSAMAAGQAILAVCPRESDLADLVSAHGCGWVVDPGDVTGLDGLLAMLPKIPDELLKRRRNAWNAAHTKYSMEAVGRLWKDLFDSLDAP